MAKSLKEVFTFYTDIFKPQYCLIEAKDNTLPVEILFEIHAAFDHIKRIFYNGEPEETACHHARSHLARATLDCYKLRLKYFNVDYENFIKGNGYENLKLINNGTFYNDLNKQKLIITKLAKDARYSESQNDKEKAFTLWSEVSSIIDSFEETFFHDPENKIEWASKFRKKINLITDLKNILINFIVGLTVYFLTKYFDDIKKFLLDIF